MVSIGRICKVSKEVVNRTGGSVNVLEPCTYEKEASGVCEVFQLSSHGGPERPVRLSNCTHSSAHPSSSNCSLPPTNKTTFCSSQASSILLGTVNIHSLFIFFYQINWINEYMKHYWSKLVNLPRRRDGNSCNGRGSTSGSHGRLCVCV